MNRNTVEMLSRLRDTGISTDDALALRRIAMTLHRWHELECGDGNNYGSWCITRGKKSGKEFEHNDDGAPYLEHHHYLHGHGKDYVSYSKLADRERGALKRLAKIMAKYPTYWAYVQTDPRGAPLYIIDRECEPESHDATANYSRGIAVYK